MLVFLLIWLPGAGVAECSPVSESVVPRWSVTETWSVWDKVGDDWQNLLSSFFQIHKICLYVFSSYSSPVTARIMDGGTNLNFKFPVAC